MGCSPPQKLSKLFIKQNGHCLFSEYKKQGLTSERKFLLCKLLFVYNLPDKVIGIDFKAAVLNLYYKMRK